MSDTTKQPKDDDDRGVVLRRELKPKDRLNLRVSAGTPVKSLAGSIYNAIIQDQRDLALLFVGHGAAGQALKGLVAAQQMLSPSGLILYIRPCFEKNVKNLKQGDEELSVMKLIIHLTD